MVYIISRNTVANNTSDNVSVWRQFIISFLANLPFFAYGVNSNILHELSHSGTLISDTDVPWSTLAYILASIVTAPIHCVIMNKFGRKVGMYIIVILQGISCIPLLLSSSEASSISIHAIAGISTGGLVIIVPTYVREISSDEVRGFTTSFLMPMTATGGAMKLVLSVASMVYLVVALVIVELVSIFFIPESPSFLLRINRIEDAKAKLAILCGNDEAKVSNELCKLKDESETAKSKGELTTCTILKNNIWRDQMKIGLFLNTTTILSGCSIFLDQDKVLAQLKTDVDPQKLLIPLCLVIGSFGSVVLLRFVDRKYVLSSAYTVMVLSMGLLAVYTQADLTVTSLRWVPFVALATLVFSYGVIWILPTVVLVEMLNLEIRVFVMGIVYVYTEVIRLSHVLTFRYLEDYIGVYTLLYMFACINILSAIYSISMVPEIKNKSIKQIEKQLRRVPILKF